MQGPKTNSPRLGGPICNSLPASSTTSFLCAPKQNREAGKLKKNLGAVATRPSGGSWEAEDLSGQCRLLFIKQLPSLCGELSGLRLPSPQRSYNWPSQKQGRPREPFSTFKKPVPSPPSNPTHRHTHTHTPPPLKILSPPFFSFLQACCYVLKAPSIQLLQSILPTRLCAALFIKQRSRGLRNSCRVPRSPTALPSFKAPGYQRAYRIGGTRGGGKGKRLSPCCFFFFFARPFS